MKIRIVHFIVLTQFFHLLSPVPFAKLNNCAVRKLVFQNFFWLLYPGRKIIVSDQFPFLTDTHFWKWISKCPFQNSVFGSKSGDGLGFELIPKLLVGESLETVEIDFIVPDLGFLVYQAGWQKDEGKQVPGIRKFPTEYSQNQCALNKGFALINWNLQEINFHFGLQPGSSWK